MSEMIEILAQRLQDASMRPDNGATTVQIIGDVRRFWRTVAEAAIRGMREPTDAILKAMRDTMPVDGHEWEFMEREELRDGTVIDHPGDHWRAMIDAALS